MLAAAQLQCGPCCCCCAAGVQGGFERTALVRRPCARQRNDSMCRYVHHGRGLASQRGRSVAAKSIYHHPNAAASGVQRRLSALGESPPVVHRAQPRAGPPRAKRVCGGACFSRRVLTPHGPWMGPHGCTKSAVPLQGRQRNTAATNRNDGKREKERRGQTKKEKTNIEPLPPTRTRGGPACRSANI